MSTHAKAKNKLDQKDCVKKTQPSVQYVIKDSDDDGITSPAFLIHHLKVERLQHDLKSGKLFSNGSATIR